MYSSYFFFNDGYLASIVTSLSGIHKTFSIVFNRSSQSWPFITRAPLTSRLAGLFLTIITLSVELVAQLLDALIYVPFVVDILGTVPAPGIDIPLRNFVLGLISFPWDYHNHL
jgi:hypothetical protein